MQWSSSKSVHPASRATRTVSSISARFAIPVEMISEPCAQPLDQREVDDLEGCDLVSRRTEGSRKSTAVASNGALKTTMSRSLARSKSGPCHAHGVWASRTASGVFDQPTGRLDHEIGAVRVDGHRVGRVRLELYGICTRELRRLEQRHGAVQAAVVISGHLGHHVGWLGQPDTPTSNPDFTDRTCCEASWYRSPSSSTMATGVSQPAGKASQYRSIAPLGDMSQRCVVLSRRSHRSESSATSRRTIPQWSLAAPSTS